MRLKQSLGLAIIAGTLSAGSAMAKPGEHIKLGDTVVTPSLSVGFQVRSNAFRSETEPQVAGNLNLRPNLVINHDTPDFQFNTTAGYTARKFVLLTQREGFGDDVTRSQIRALDRFNSFDGSLKLDGFKTRVMGIRLGDNAVVANNPNDGFLEGDHPYVSQIRNTLYGGIVVRPGPAIETDLRGQWGWARFFIPSADSPRQAFNTRNSYGPRLQVKWLFLPRTALVLNLGYTYNNWVSDAPSSDELQNIRTPDSHFVKADAGLQGRISNRLRVILRIGYGGGIYAEGAQTTALGGLLGTAQVSYKASDQHEIAVGYRKSFFDSYFTNVTETNTLYGSWNGKYGERVTSRLKYGLRFENYRGFDSRRDLVNNLEASIGVNAAEWLNVSLQGTWLQRASSDDFVEYDDVRGGINLTAQY